MIRNSVRLIGRLGADPELKQIRDDLSVVNVSLAEDVRKGDEQLTQWHRLKAWNKRAESMEKYCRKGDLIAIEGRIEYREHEGKHYTDIIVESWTMCSKKDNAPRTDRQQSEAAHQYNQAEAARHEPTAQDIVNTSPEDALEILEESGDDLPF